MRIIKVTLNGIDISEERAKELAVKYINTHMAMECFMGGITVVTPEGDLQAEVSIY